MPFIKLSTLKQLVSHHQETDSYCTLLTLKTKVKKDFGRILRNEDGRITGIVENSDANTIQKTIDEYSTGVYCFEKELAFEVISNIDNNNSQVEYYLTDTIQIIEQNRLTINSVQTKDAEEIFGINCENDLKNAEQILTGHSSC